MNRALMSSVAVIALVGAVGANAGEIVLTGHDNDFHRSAAASAATDSEVTFVLDGHGTTTPSAADFAAPLLTFDQGSELTGLLASLGFTNVTNVSTTAGITAGLFDHTKYAAMIVASVTSCGGCDNSPTFINGLTAQSAAIASFFNAGSGIVALAGASDASAYAYIPRSATNAGGNPPSTGYVTTAAGGLLGLPAVNGDTTHNFFNEPGTGGLSASYVVTERLGDPETGTPETIALAGTTTCIIAGTCHTVPVPEPASLSLLGAGLFGLAAAARLRKRRRADEANLAA